MISILTELEKRTNENPNRLLYAFLDVNGNIKESYTYREFYYRTKSIASHIYRTHSFAVGDRILLAYPPGLEMICAFFSCVRLGLIPVPVYPPTAQGFDAAIQKMNFIAEDCGAKAILTEHSYYWSIQANLTRKKSEALFTTSDFISTLKWIISNDSNAAEVTDFPEKHSDILFLQYTSGSTSNPKGVIVSHQNIIHNCRSVVDHIPIGVSWLPQYHDMGLIGYYIFFALKGGTTYGFSPIDFIQRPALWLETISKYSGTASSAPNFAYEYCLDPSKISEQILEHIDLSSLKFLMTAAEPVNTEVYKKFLSKFSQNGLKAESFFAAYGLAEFTLAVTNYGRDYNSFDTNSLKENIVKRTNLNEASNNTTSLMSCGKPLGDAEIKIVELESLTDVTKQKKVGEIWLNGTSKCAGYWNRPDLTKELFEATLEERQNNNTWLRTGDLGFIFDDELYVCGRVKDMIIIRGLNYYPQDIENIIEQNAFIRKGCVSAFSIDRAGHESLIAVIGLKSNNKIPDPYSINNSIIKHLGISADTFVFVPARTISKTSSGKIMRHQNKNRFVMNTHQIISQIELLKNDIENKKEDAFDQNTTACDWSDYRSLLKNYGLTGEEHQSLGNAGLDSLKLAEFTHDLKVFIQKNGYADLASDVDLRLVQKIAISELCEILNGLQNSKQLSRFKFKNAFSRLNRENAKIEMEMMKKDASSLIAMNSKEEAVINTHSVGHILLTGGTGFFGPFILKSILEQNQEDVYVLLRAADIEEGKHRLGKAFTMIDPDKELIDHFERRVKIICGDISRARLGVKDDDWNFLAKNIHTIYHNGALVNYLLDYESMRHANINGTIEVIKLASHTRSKILNYISTTFIFGWSVKDTLFETDCNEVMENLDFGYSQSKWASEQIVKKAMNNGLRARIFRPALISPSIKGKGYNFDISIRLLAFMVKYGIGTSALNQVSFTPADIAANNIVAISNIHTSIGLTFHVTRDTYSSMRDITNILERMVGKSFEIYPLNEYVLEVVNRCEKDDLLFPLLNFLVRSEDKISAMEFKRYGNANYTTFRDESKWGRKDPDLDDVVKGILLFMQSHGIIEDKSKQISHV